MRVVEQRLYLHQQRARAFLRDHHAGTGHLRAVLRQEQRGRIAHFAQAFFGHGEHAELVHRAEAVLERAHQAKTGMGVALEIQHGIDDMLQHSGARQRAFLGDVADEDDGDAAALGQARELRRAFAHLRHRAGRGSELFGIHGLDGVDHHHVRLFVRDGGLDFFQLDFRQQMHFARIQRKALGTQRDLLRRFFAADVQDFFGRGEMRQRLQQQRGFADAGIAADQHHPAFHQPAAQHAVELGDAGRRARHFARFHLGQLLQLAGCRQCAVAVLACRRHRFRHRFHQRVPLAATAGTGLAIWGIVRRIRCSYRSFLLLPC